MEIKLDKTHTLMSDKYQFWVEKVIPYTTKQGEKAERTEIVSGYCPTPRLAMQSMSLREMRGIDEKPATKIEAEMEKISKKIDIFFTNIDVYIDQEENKNIKRRKK